MINDFKKISELRTELDLKGKKKNSLREIIKWYKKIIKTSGAKVIKIKLSDCKNWETTRCSIKHKSNKFFRVEAIRIQKVYNREIGQGWDQPILVEPNYKGGILGLLRKNFNGMPHYLVNAKFEPGNYNLIQLSPTLQATFSNINRAHKGKEPRFLSFFTNPKQNDCEIIFKQWFSEEGGRLMNKRNLGILIDHKSNTKIPLYDDFKWITLKQIKQLILQNAMVNPHLRGLVSFV